MIPPVLCPKRHHYHILGIQRQKVPGSVVVPGKDVGTPAQDVASFIPGAVVTALEGKKKLAQSNKVQYVVV